MVHDCRQCFRTNTGSSPAEQQTLGGGDERTRTQKPLTRAADGCGGWLGTLFLQTIYSIRKGLAPITNQPAAAWALEDICQRSVNLRIRPEEAIVLRRTWRQLLQLRLREIRLTEVTRLYRVRPARPSGKETPPNRGRIRTYSLCCLEEPSSTNPSAPASNSDHPPTR